ncbi:uncharacterized protein N7515_009441 [Penicillium bovifimosum]|uniref:Uncharacterized protein n=1 Tax=Penicillium bovifimosum TaxID=126998 RepID=A0A9W9GJL6_9EURO|nr:uncharacterized protein N7515_009441 [Penicillium bovifimosum]KAJ5121480.1 hypothetical protein N7515_009441 [Penicillium bovifimosum]
MRGRSSGAAECTHSDPIPTLSYHIRKDHYDINCTNEHSTLNTEVSGAHARVQCTARWDRRTVLLVDHFVSGIWILEGQGFKIELRMEEGHG